ncbi:glutamine amidotransferase [Actinomycetaceae bacterium MB13-C1-2]|nr:glutamine amidotransferase [Actinomycetaceae bacterium MB13-C1-2]
MTDSALRVGLIYPSILGTYGDGGNARILAERARRRGFDAEVVVIDLGATIPAELDVYTLGGGEDVAQAIAAQSMRGDRGLCLAVEANKPVLAICAAMQLLGTEYTDATGVRVEGLGLLDVVTSPMGKRAIGEVVEQPLIEGLTQPLTGFENHGGRTRLGSGAKPLGRVVVGTGNGDESRVEGAVQGSIIGTYLHGPALARNPELADLILSRVLGGLEPLEIPGVERLRAERLASARTGAPGER